MTRRSSGHQAVPSTAEDGLDDQLWRYVCDEIVAVYLNDRVAFRAVGGRLWDYVRTPGVDADPGIWLFYLVRTRSPVAALVRCKPTMADLEELTERYQDAYWQFMYRQIPLLDVLTSAWELASEQDDLTGTAFWYGAMVALGVLLDDPRSQLDAMRPDLAEWYRDTMRQALS